MLGEVFQRFVQRSPLSVMVRGTLERVLGAEQLGLVYSLIGHRIGYSHSQEVSRCIHKRFP